MSLETLAAIAAIHVVPTGVDDHLSDCDLARESGPDATRACAECGRARWMHATRHDTCGSFCWVTFRSITDGQILMLRAVPGIGAELEKHCELAGPHYYGDSVRRDARRACANAINVARKRLS